MRRSPFRTPLSQRIGDVLVLVLAVPAAGAAAGFVTAIAATAILAESGRSMPWFVPVAGAALALGGLFLVRGLPAWSLALEEDAAVFGSLWRRRVPYDEIVFIAAGTLAGWMGHEGRSQTRPVRVESARGRTATIRLKHAAADKALRALHARSRNAAALDAHGDEYLPASGDPDAILAARSRLAREWAPVVWLSLAGVLAGLGIAVVPVVIAARDGDWSEVAAPIVFGLLLAFAFGTGWWKALKRMRGHRGRVRRAVAALRESGEPAEPDA